MSDYVLSCCSTADLAKEHFEEIGVNYICFHYTLDDVDYLDDLGQSMAFEEFYNKMAEGSDTRTSQVNADEFEEYFESFLKEGKDILHITLSSGLSGVVNSAFIAKRNLEEKYPDRKIYIVDSLNASSGYGLIMNTLAEMRDEGKTIDELYNWIEENKLRMQSWFFSMDLSFYIKGGRISKTAGTIGKVLSICPLLNIDYKGKLTVRSKVRTKKKAFKEVVNRMEEHAQDGLDYSGKVYISQSACIEDAKEVAKLIEERFPKLNGSVEINHIGTTIGSHTGPGTVALFFWGDERVD